MFRYLLLVFSVFISFISAAQNGKITGKVITAASGQPLAGATVVLLSEKQRSVAADLNGSFTFGRLAAGTYSVKCTYAGYREKIIDEIVVKDGESTPVNISLDEVPRNAVVITGTRLRAAGENVASLLIAQKNAAAVSDGITAETIRKTPDRSTSDVIKRVSGASIQDDRFAVIRGLNDRYNAAFLNGAPLPSTESDRKAFAFDIFPSSILDNLVIYKTATPDKSGEFAGGLIDITTKSIPAKNFTSISIGGSYNTLATGNPRLHAASKGKTDWLGIDDGTRAIPAGIPSSTEIKNMTFAQRADLAKAFGNYKWGLLTDNTSPNFNFQVSRGLNIERRQQEFLGALFSVTYNKNFTFTEGERNTFDFDVSAPAGSVLIAKGKYRDSVYNDETVVAALANFSVKLNGRNSIAWKNNFSINTDNKVVRRFGRPDYDADSFFLQRDAVRWFTSNRIFSSQLSGEHQLGSRKTRVNWMGAFSKVRRDVPNLSRTSYVGYDPDFFADFASGPITQNTGSGVMFFSETDETIQSVRADITQPFTFMKSSQNFLKAGGGYQYRNRNFSSRLLGFSPYRSGGVVFDNSLLQLPEDQIFAAGNLGKLSSGQGGFLLNDGTLSNSDYKASSALTHGYLMGDQRFFKKFRLVYGARVERFNQRLTSFKDINKPVDINTVITDVLPSVNFVYAATPKMNLRLSYSKTINRPEFRELAPFLFYDFVTQYTFEGFDTLQRAVISNFDFRYEFFPGRAQLFSVSAFYKKFTNPIEIVSNPVFDNLAIYSNAQSAEVYGVEAEFRTLLSTLVGIRKENAFLSRFTLAANGAYIRSNVKLGRFGLYDPALLVTDRALQGQSPYIINASLGYNDDKLGLSSTLSVNRVGDRITIAGTIFDADIYEKARTVIDFQVAKFLLKNKLELKFTARDLLAQKVNYYFDFDKSRSWSESDRYFSTNIAPRVLSFSAAYKF